jgi:hypothetical protein
MIIMSALDDFRHVYFPGTVTQGLLHIIGRYLNPSTPQRP